MNLIRINRNFLKDAKRLKKKFLSLRGELDELFQELAENPQLGAHLGDNRPPAKVGIVKQRTNLHLQESQLA